ncbi:MAG: hypothetical protein ACRDRW_02620 [Pseudonocardiaceae bacterium]
MNIKLQKVVNANAEQMRQFAENSLVKLVRCPAISEEEKEMILGCFQHRGWNQEHARLAS